MAIYATAKRIADGILGWVAKSDNPPQESAIIQSMGVDLLGGTSMDYAYQELTPEQNAALVAAMPARSKLVGGVLTSATPISLSLSAGTVTADGVASITLSINTHDTGYNGAVKLKVTPPDGEPITDTLTAVSGLVSEPLSTGQVGIHSIEVETVPHGLAFSSFEGGIT